MNRIEYNHGEQVGDAIFLHEVAYYVKSRTAEFRCKCGNKFTARICKVKSFEIKGCGCSVGKSIGSRNHKTHGLRHHPLYSVWHTMRARCYNENTKCYKNYGGRGVIICDEWLDDFISFYNWAIENGWQKGMQIDKEIKARILGIEPLLYSPSMCSIVTPKQNSNNRRSNVTVEYNGIVKTGAEWASLFNLKVETFWARLKRGWSMDKALNTKVA